MNNEPKVIKRHGEVGFRRMGVEFNKDEQKVLIHNYTFHSMPIAFDVTDFLNLVEQATWYFDQFASREER